MRNKYRAGIFIATGLVAAATYGCAPDAPATPTPMAPPPHPMNTPAGTIPVVPNTPGATPINATPIVSGTPATPGSPVVVTPAPTKTP